jgi:hypothetical protein
MNEATSSHKSVHVYFHLPAKSYRNPGLESLIDAKCYICPAHNIVALEGACSLGDYHRDVYENLNAKADIR